MKKKSVPTSEELDEIIQIDTSDEETEGYGHEVVDHAVGHHNSDEKHDDFHFIENVTLIPEIVLNDDYDGTGASNDENKDQRMKNIHSSGRHHFDISDPKYYHSKQAEDFHNEENEDSSPSPTENDKERIQKLKALMLSELSVNHIPLTGFSVPSTIVLPSEQQKIRDYAIGTKVKRRDRMINESFRKRNLSQLKTKNGESVDIPSIPPSQSVEQLDQIENQSSFLTKYGDNKWIKRITTFLYSGPFWNRPEKLKKATKLNDVRKEDIEQVKATIIDLGYALCIYGTPAHRLEYHLALVASFYAINCTTYSTPGGIWITFGNYVDDPNAATHFVKIRASTLNLSKLCLLDDVAEKIADGTLTIKQGRKAIKEIIEMQPIYSNFVFIILSCFVQAGMFSIFFSANYGEILASLIAGLFVGALSVLASRFENYAQVNTIICALVAGLVGVIFRMIMSSLVPISVFVVSLSGVISLLPGLSFTLAISELSTRNLLSGSTRLISAFVTTIQIGFGVLVSDRVSLFLPTVFDVPNVTVRNAHSVYTLAAIIPVVTIATVIALKAPKYPVAVVFILLDAYAGFFCTYYATIYFGAEAGAMLGAFIVGFISNVFGYVSRHPGIVVSACGIIFCLPGAIGTNSAQILNDSDPSKFVFEVVIVAISLTVGLMLSDAFVLKRKKLNL
jgi:uncharacterized membrane protein YjjP (DUF1212 family)